MKPHLLNRTRLGASLLFCLAPMAFSAGTLAGDLNPALVSEWPEQPVGWMSHVAVRGHYAYVGGAYTSGCHVLDISDPTGPRWIGASGVTINSSTEFSGDYAYVPSGSSGLQVIDLSDPAHPRRVGGVDTSGQALDVVIAGNYAYLLEAMSYSQGWLRAIDIGDPTHPVEVEAYAIDARTLHVEVSDNHLFALGWARFADGRDYWALDCFDISNPARLERVGHFQRDGKPIDMAVSGQWVYVSALRYELNYASVEVLDASDPTSPYWVTGYNNNQETGFLAASGSHLYLAKTGKDGRAGLDVLDASNPASLRKLGTYFGEVSGAAVSGNQAYIASNGHFEVLDFSNPAAPLLTGTWMTEPQCHDVAHVGTSTYVVGPIGLTTYLNILDTSDSAKPRLMGSMSVPGWTERVEVLGDYAYVVTQNGLYVVDVTDPTAPKRTGTIKASTAATDVAFAGDYAFLADWDSGVQILTITNRASPRRLATFFADDGGPVVGVCAGSKAAYLLIAPDQGRLDPAYNSTVETLDMADPVTPVRASSYQTAGVLTRGMVSGNYLYLTKRYLKNPDRSLWAGMLEILDISDPAIPQRVSQYETTGIASDVTVSDGLAYVACTGGSTEGGPRTNASNDADRGLDVIDVSDPAHPRRVGGYQRSWLSGIATDAGRVYGAGYWTGLQIIDARPEASLSRVAALDTPDKACGLALAGSQLLVADRLTGIQVVDVSDPTRPTETATLYSAYNTDPIWDVAVSGTTVYAASDEAGVQTFDLNNLEVPLAIGVYDTPGQARGITLAGPYAYVADGGAGLQILDVNNPEKMLSVGSVDTTGFANAVALMGNLALVADWEDGLVIVDVSDPKSPRIVGNYNTGGYTLAVAVVGSNALLSDGVGGFQVVDLSEPLAPELLGSTPADGWARNIAVHGRFAYVADAFAGVQVYDISDPRRPLRKGGTTAVDPYAFVSEADHLFVAGGNEGLAVFDLYTPPLGVAVAPTQTADSISLRVDGPAGRSVRIQRSSDLLNWRDWQQVVLSEAPITVAAPITSGAPREFYRTVSP